MSDNWRAVSKFKGWQKDILKFVWDNFGVTPDDWQREALEAFQSEDPKKQRISLQACAGPGKSAVLSWVGWWFLACKFEGNEHPKGAAVSITADNLRDNLWPEFSKWQIKSPFLSATFTWTKTRIYCNDFPDTWFLSARTFSKAANAEEQGRTLSGLHSKFVLCLIDESGDIPIAVAKAGEQALGNCGFGKIVQAGNPTSQSGMLYAASATHADQWHVISITGDPDDPKRSPRISKEWAEKQIKQYGRNDPWVKAYILGRFPDGGINTLLSVNDIEDAMSRAPRKEDFMYAQKRLGIDVAREGIDSSVIFPRQGIMAFNCAEMRGAKSHEVAARVMRAKARWQSEMEFVDNTGGYGAGVVDSLIQAGQNPTPINFSGKPIDSRFHNIRAEMWFKMAEWVKRGGALPRNERLKKELSSVKYSFKNGKFIIEPKEKIKETLGHSPDLSDALALTFALPDMPSANSLEGRKQQNKDQRKESDFDPFLHEGRERVDFDPFR